MDIKTLWIQIVNYIASAASAAVVALLIHLLPGVPDAGSAGIGVFVGYLVHHFLDGLLNSTKVAIAQQQATVVQQQATIASLQQQVQATQLAKAPDPTPAVARIDSVGNVALAAS